MLHKQLGSNELLTSDEILEKWLQLALPKEQFDELLRLGGFKDKVKVRWVGLIPLVLFVTLSVCLVLFLDAPSHLYKRGCPSVPPYVRMSVSPLALRKMRFIEY